MAAVVSPAVALEEAEAVHGDVLGIVFSVCLIGLCGLLALLVVRIGRGRSRCSNANGGSLYPEIARKIVHIGVSNWFFIYYFVFERSFWAIVGLCSFAVVNAVFNLTGAMGVLFDQTSNKRNWGMVYYPLSVVLLIVLADFGFGDELCVGCALIGMGYGDGLAALVGMRFGRHGLCSLREGGSDASKHRSKTVEGSLTMFLVVLVSFVLLNVLLGDSGIGLAIVFGLLAALASTFAEAYTLSGLDNVTVPLVIYVAAAVMRLVWVL